MISDQHSSRGVRTQLPCWYSEKATNLGHRLSNMKYVWWGAPKYEIVAAHARSDPGGLWGRAVWVTHRICLLAN